MIPTEYDLIGEMKHSINNGDSIKLKTEYAYDTYTREGRTTERKYLRITGFSALEDEINFDAPDFEEYNSVYMDVIIKNVMETPKNELAVDGYVVDGFKKPIPVELIAAPADKFFGLKKLRFGTLITVTKGSYLNSMSQTEQQVKNKAGFGEETITKYTDDRKRGIYITNVDGTDIKEGLYSPDDIAGAMQGAVVTPKATPKAKPVVAADIDEDLDDDLDLELD